MFFLFLREVINHSDRKEYCAKGHYIWSMNNAETHYEKCALVFDTITYDVKDVLKFHA